MKNRQFGLWGAFGWSPGGGGGTDIERGYGDVWLWRPPFHASPVAFARVPFEQPVVHKGPISSNSQFTRPSVEKKWEILGSTMQSQYWPKTFCSHASKFGNFQFTRLPFWRQAMISSQAPTSKIRAAQPYLQKKLSEPPTVVTEISNLYPKRTWVPPGHWNSKAPIVMCKKAK